MQNQKWLWAIPALALVIVAVVVATGKLQRGLLPFPSGENREFLTKPMKKLPDLVVNELNYEKGYVVIENIGELPVTKSFKTKVTMPCFGSTSIQTFVARNLSIERPLRYNFDPNKTCKTNMVTAQVDSGKNIAESDETNNILVYTVSSPTPTQPSEARCKQLKMWADQGVLTPNIGGNWADVTACQSQYGQFYVNANRCTQLKVWRDQGFLTFNMGGNIADARACSFYYSNIWNAPAVTEARCKQLQQWYDQRVFTPNIGNNFWQLEECKWRFGSQPGLVNAQRCTVLKTWKDQGVLTQNLGNNFPEPQACSFYFPNIWNAPAQTSPPQPQSQGITKAEFATAVVKKLGKDVSSYKGCAPDAIGQWYENYVCYFVSNGFFILPPDGKVHAGDLLTRAAGAQVFVNVLIPQNLWYQGNTQFYSDVLPDEWFYQAINTLVSRNISDVPTGPSAKFNPPFVLTKASLQLWLDKLIQPLSPLTVINPAVGQWWPLGSQLPIKWSGGDPNWKVNLILNNAAKTQTVLIIDQNIANTNNQFGVVWSIPTNLALGQYTIRVACSSGPNVCPSNGWFADSGAFTIK